MQQYTDNDGLEFTTSAPENIEIFTRLARSYLGFRRDISAILKKLLNADPAMPMAICAKGYFAKLMASAVHSQRAEKTSRQLDEMISKTPVTQREQLHAAALSAWCRGQIGKAASLWEDILDDYPLDAFAFRLSHYAHFYSGDGKKMRDSVERILPHWSESHPNYGFVLGAFAFGLEESGDYIKAERCGREATERNPRDAWSVHSVAHVMEMTGRHAEGIEWITMWENDWSTVNNFRFHLYWHQCLFHLERGEFDAVLRLYDEQVASQIETDFNLDMCNATSLLWRLELFGVDVGDRWHALNNTAKNHCDDRDLIFVSLHYLMAMISAKDCESAKALIDNLDGWARLDETQGKITADVGLALAEGLRLARNHQPAEAARLFEQASRQISAIGGSKAQQDIFQMILIDSVRKSGDDLKLRSLLAERAGQRPVSRWL